MIHSWGRTSLAATLSLFIGFAAVGFSACTSGRADRGIASVDLSHSDLGSVLSKEDIALRMGTEFANNRFPDIGQFEIGSIPVNAKLRYAFEPTEQAYMEKLLRQYRPDYGVFVAMDAKTGRIITMASRRQGDSEAENLALRATFPAASIFKIVTAGAVLDTDMVSPETRIAFNGANHTLYRRNVVETKENRWTRRITVREAFGSSVNTVFGKLGLFYAGPEVLRTYAERFHFNHPIRADLPVQTGYSRFTADDPWSVVSAASGFTLDNTMSPLQGAMIAAAVANDGVMMEPYVVDAVLDEQDQPLYQASPRRASVTVAPDTARQLRELFEQTVTSGTSRSSFRKTVRKRKFEDVEFGGKTGSLTGMNPRGKCDWFVGYARFGDQRIAVAALTVNEEKWRVKSSTLAQLFLSDYVKTHHLSGR
ncbi:MAG: penicillin-binding transpeptidase domain-containing protein [Bdellovibrionales bacterium]|nr:penicillin-binding transpeptidase domain-containing protein [Bdellovibrionales bacterium]